MDFLAELKRRSVIRMAGLYLVGAWLIVQVAGTVLPMSGAPDWIARSRATVVGDCHTNFSAAIDYPCSTSLPADTIAASVAVLRGNPDIIPLLRLRVADVETDLGNLLVHDGDIRKGLHDFTVEQR